MRSEDRELVQNEKLLITELIRRSGMTGFENWGNGMKVIEMDDGGMGSLILIPNVITPSERRFGSEIAQLEFLDDDNIVVNASLNIDQHGHLYELDIWKVDFSPLIRIPESFE